MKKAKPAQQPRERIVAECGPYKGYFGRAEYDFEDRVFFGTVLGLRDVIHFEAHDPQKISLNFRESVDEYLRYCAQRGEMPETAFSGKFLARVNPDIHRRLVSLAEARGISLNQIVAEAVGNVVQTGDTVADAVVASPKVVKHTKRGMRVSQGARSATRK